MDTTTHIYWAHKIGVKLRDFFIQQRGFLDVSPTLVPSVLCTDISYSTTYTAQKTTQPLPATWLPVMDNLLRENARVAGLFALTSLYTPTPKPVVDMCIAGSLDSATDLLNAFFTELDIGQNLITFPLISSPLTHNAMGFMAHHARGSAQAQVLGVQDIPLACLTALETDAATLHRNAQTELLPNLIPVFGEAAVHRALESLLSLPLFPRVNMHLDFTSLTHVFYTAHHLSRPNALETMMAKRYQARLKPLA